MNEPGLSVPRQKRNPYRIRGEQVWALVRARYLAGESARQVAEDLNVTEYAIRRRITREGWSKRALAEAEEARAAEAAGGATGGEAMAEPEEPLEPRAAARAALDEAARLMRVGRMAAAIEAARAADLLGRAAMRLIPLHHPSEGPHPPVGEDWDDEAAFEAVRRKVLGSTLCPGERGPMTPDAEKPLDHPSPAASDGPPPPTGEEP